jgi:hypothetical protein
MKETEPSRQEWQDLYQAAGEFYNLKPWDWMSDADLFGVLNAESGEIEYCCVMGNAGELYALAVYLGTEGLDGYLALQSGEMGAEEMLFHQLCLMISFEDRSGLGSKDLQVIKSLGLKFRGRQVWPLMRSYRPGFLPWLLNAQEARILTTALQRTVVVAERFKENQAMLEPPEDDLYFVQVPESRDGGIEWRDRWLPPAPLEPPDPVELPAVDESRLSLIKQKCEVSHGTWEIDCSFAPFPVGEQGERPYFPRLLIWVDRETKMILGFHLTDNAGYLPEFQARLLEFMEKSGRIPRHISAIDEELFDALLPAATGLGIRLRLVEEFDCIDDVRENMAGFLARGM